MACSVFLSGAVGGFFGALAAHPFDLARVINVIKPSDKTELSMYATLKGITKSHGPRALTIGLGARLMRLQFTNAIIMPIYMTTRDLISESELL